MKAATIIKKMEDVLDLDGKKKKRDALKKVLKKLKDKENRLKHELKHEKHGKERKSLKAKIDVIKAQRKNGIKHLRKLAGKK